MRRDPCKGCTERWVTDDGKTCHTDCKDYLEAKQLRDEQRRVNQEQRQIDFTLSRLQTQRITKRIHKTIGRSKDW